MLHFNTVSFEFLFERLQKRILLMYFVVNLYIPDVTVIGVSQKNSGNR